MSTNKKHTEEEVDLNSLFIIIGRGFSKFFNFLGNIFKTLFHLLILFLLFIKFHFLKFIIAAVLGGGIGFFLESYKETTYESYLKVQPNFNSTDLLYTNIENYNKLVSQKDIEELINIFGISEAEAKSLRSFKIKPIKNKADIVKSYDDFVLSADSLSVKEYSFSDFKNNLKITDYRTHIIHVESADSKVFSKLGNEIISSVLKNQFFDRYKKIRNEELDRTYFALRENLTQIDSLRKVYMKVLIEESKKELKGGTNINLSPRNDTGNKETEFFDISNEINEQLDKVSKSKAEEYEMINVISNFKKGSEVKRVSRNFVFLSGIASVLLVLIFIALRELNSYLENYKNK